MSLDQVKLPSVDQCLDIVGKAIGSGDVPMKEVGCCFIVCLFVCSLFILVGFVVVFHRSICFLFEFPPNF